MSQRRRSARRQAGRQQRSTTQTLEPQAPSRRRQRPTGARAIPRPVLIGGALFMAIVLAVVGVNWLFSVKRPGDVPILQVNSRKFSWNEYIEILRFQKLAAESLGGQFQMGQAPYDLMQLMADNEIVRQTAAREGLLVTTAMVRQEMVSRLVPNAAQIADPKDVEKELEVRLDNYLSAVRLPYSRYEEIVRTDVYRDQLRVKLGVDIPRVQPHLYLHLIKVTSEETQTVEKALKDGVPFGTVARRYSSEQNAKVNAGEVGWTPRLVYRDLDEILYGLGVGETSRPIVTPQGLWILRVLRKEAGSAAEMQGILVRTAEDADEAKKLLGSGVDFASVAAQFSIDPSKGNGGKLGVVRVGDRGEEFDEIVQGAVSNQRLGPIDTGTGVYFAMVTERSDAQEVSENHLEVLEGRALDQWLTQERAKNLINYCPSGPNSCFGSIKVERALKQIADVSITKVQEDATATAAASQAGKAPF